MSSFKELIQEDAAVFLNDEEFAETHVIDGQEMVIVIDEDELYKRKASASNPEDGIHSADLLFFVVKSNFESRPVIGKPMKVNNRLYRIGDVQDDDPVMYTILLERTGS